MDEHSVAKKMKSDCDSTDTRSIEISTTTTGGVKSKISIENDNSNSCSSNVSNLMNEADKALQESNKRHVRPIIEESKLGIEIFIGDTKNQFHGLIKTRYADFIVHEIDLVGNVAKLTDLQPPVEEEAASVLKLEDLFERKILVCLSNVNSGVLDSYKIDVTGVDKDTRTSIHHAIRESYDRLESSTVSDSDSSQSRNNKSGTRASAKTEQAATKSDTQVSTSSNDEQLNLQNSSIENEQKLKARTKITDGLDEKKYILVTRRNKSSRNRSIWPRGRPDYTHFVLYKENKDTMDAIHNLAIATNSKPCIFTYAGTKDRRAVTTQWVSGWRVDPRRLIGAMKRFNKRPYIKVGNFSFKKEPIRLGQLQANRFDLVIRHLVHNSGGQQVIEDSMRSIKEKGFVNYFGLQRFGTRTVQTHEIGLAILQSKWDKATDLILSYRYDENSPQETNLETNPAQQDGNNNNGNTAKVQRLSETDGQKSARQQGKYWARGAEQHNACIDLWRSKMDAELVFKKFPHFRITNEGMIIKALAKSAISESGLDYSAALSSLPRNTRSMYVHSYQSLLWNKLATYRLKKHGQKVLVGDLILPPETNISDGSLEVLLSAAVAGEESNDIQVNDLVNDDPERDVSSEKQHEQVTTSGSEAKPKNELIDEIHSKILIASEEDLGRFTIFDVVLPLPGSRVKIPQNDVGAELERLLKDDGLTLESFRAREKVFVSYGSYRKILVRPANLTWDIKQYSNPRENLIETDLDELYREPASGHDKHMDSEQRPNSPLKSDSCDEALIISFDLPPSSYATMCLRELMKKPSTDFNNRF